MFVLECKDGRLADVERLAMFVAADCCGPVVRGGDEHMSAVFGGEQIDGAGNRLCRNRAYHHLRWLGLQYAEQLPLINSRVRSTVVCRKNSDLHVFGGHGRKFEFLIGRVEELHILGLKLSNRLERPGGRFVPLQQLKLLHVGAPAFVDQHGKCVEGCGTFVPECKDGRLAEAVIDTLVAFFAVDGAGPVVRGGDEHMSAVFAQAALDYGLSRPTIYEAQENFRQTGIGGLLPQKRGPKKARKLTPEVRFYLEELVGSEPDLKATALVQRVRRRFGIVLHPRTVEKAVRKKGRQTS